SPVLDSILAGDPDATEQAMVSAGFLPPNHGLPIQRVYDYVSSPYVPFQEEYFEYSREFVGRTIERALDIQGDFGDVIRKLNMPPSYVILDRVVWGVSALLGRPPGRPGRRPVHDRARARLPQLEPLARRARLCPRAGATRQRDRPRPAGPRRVRRPCHPRRARALRRGRRRRRRPRRPARR